MDRFIIDFPSYNTELEKIAISYNSDYYQTILETYKQFDTVLELVIINEISLSDFFMSLYEISRTHIDALYVIYDMQEEDKYLSDEEIDLIYSIYKSRDDSAIDSIVNNQLSTIISIFTELKEHKMTWLKFLNVIMDMSYINILGLQHTDIV